MENNLKSFKELSAAARKSIAYFVQGAILDFTEEAVSKMETLKITKTELADRLNTSPAYVTKLLGGSNNFTLETMVKVAIALDTELRIHLQRKGTIGQWIDVLETQIDTTVTKLPTPNMTHGLTICFKGPLREAANAEFALAA